MPMVWETPQKLGPQTLTGGSTLADGRLLAWCVRALMSMYINPNHYILWTAMILCCINIPFHLILTGDHTICVICTPTTIKTHKNTSQWTVWSCNWWQRRNSQCWENVFGASRHSLRHRPCPASGSNRSGSGPPSWLSVNTQSYTSNDLFGCVARVTCSFLIGSEKKGHWRSLLHTCILSV